MAQQYSSLQIRPGFNTTVTQTQNKSGWSFGNLVRWFNGLLERLGGWERLFNTATAGIARALHAYQDLQLNKTLLIGCGSSAQVYVSPTLHTFTPVKIILGTNAVNTVAGLAANGSASILMTAAADHGVTVGDTVIIPMTISIGGQIILGGSTFTVTTVATTTTFRFNMASLATTNAGGFPPNFVVTSGSVSVLAHLTAHGLSVGDSFVVQFDTVGQDSANHGQGTFTLLKGTYTVASVVDANNFRFNMATAATMTWTTAVKEGFNVQAGVLVGDFFAYIQAAALPSSNNWFLDNLGNDGLISYSNGPIYIYTAPLATSAYMANAGLTTSPQINAGIFVAMPQAQVISFGSEGTLAGGVQDPLLVRWTDTGSDTDWTASSTNQAGSYRLSRGSKIIGGIQAPQTTLLFTDTDVWTMKYVGFPAIYGFDIVGAGCGLISPKARAVLAGTCFWMGVKGFWTLAPGGTATPLKCDVWDKIFPLLDQDNLNKIHAGANSSFQEVFFFYPPDGGTGEPTSYVKLKVEGGQILWDYGDTLPRSTWLDESVFGTPLGADQTTRLIQQHEIGYDDDGAAMEGAFAETGYLDMSDGTLIMLADRAIPDMNWAGDLDKAAVDMSLKVTNYPGVDPQTSGPFSVTNTTRVLPFRGRGRQIAVRYDWAERLGYNARVGLPRFRTAPSGRQ